VCVDNAHEKCINRMIVKRLILDELGQLESIMMRRFLLIQLLTNKSLSNVIVDQTTRESTGSLLLVDIGTIRLSLSHCTRLVVNKTSDRSVLLVVDKMSPYIDRMVDLFSFDSIFFSLHIDLKHCLRSFLLVYF
jgi:hypothetical protein